MVGISVRSTFLCLATVLASQSLFAAASLNLGLTTTPLAARETAKNHTQLDSGLELALNGASMNMVLNYLVQGHFDESGDLLQNGTSQRLDAQLRSSMLDSLLYGTTRISAQSIFVTGSGKYRHQFNPTYSRSLLGLATIDMGYRFGLEGSNAAAYGDRSSAYEFRLKGTLDSLPISWRGSYTTSDTLKGGHGELVNTESFRLQSHYSVSPSMTLQMSSRLTEEAKSRSSSMAYSSALRYGAGLVWKPSTEYAVDIEIDRQIESTTGKEVLVSRGAFSWFPEAGLKLSLEYGDQLVDGARGLMLTTAFNLDRFPKVGR